MKRKRRKIYYSWMILISLYLIWYFLFERKNTILTIDLYNQYMDMHRLLLEQKGYSMFRGLGSSLMMDRLYYGMSPYGLIYLIIQGKNQWIGAMIEEILGMSIASIMMEKVLMRRYENRKIAIVGSLSYVLSGWFLMYLFNTEWLFIYSMFPLLIDYLDRYFEKNECFARMIILISFMFWSNYYLMYEVIVFLTIAFIFLKVDWKKVFKVGIVSLVVNLLFILIVLKCLSSNWRCPVKDQKTNILGLASDFLFGYDKGRIYSGMNIFLSSLVLLFFIVWLIEKNKDKLRYVMILLTMIAGAFIPFVSQIWHGIKIVWYPCRYSFIMIFLMIMLSIRGYLQWKEKEKKEQENDLMISSVFLGIVYMLGIYESKSLLGLVSLLFLVIDYVLILKKKKIVLLIYGIEVVSNAFVCLTMKDYASKKEWNQEYERQEQVLKEYKSKRLLMNEKERWNQYLGIVGNGEMFSSNLDKRTVDTYDKLGCSVGINKIHYASTKINDKLLGYNNGEIPIIPINRRTYELNENVFENQEKLSKELFGKNYVKRQKIRIDKRKNKMTLQGTMNQNGGLELILDKDFNDSHDLRIDGHLLNEYKWGMHRNKIIVQVGSYEKGDDFSIEIAGKKLNRYDFSCFTESDKIDNAKMKGMKIDSYNAKWNELRYEVVNDKDRKVMIPIEYSSLLKVIVDGKVKKNVKENDLHFLEFPLDQGKHKIEIKVK